MTGRIKCGRGRGGQARCSRCWPGEAIKAGWDRNRGASGAGEAFAADLESQSCQWRAGSEAVEACRVARASNDNGRCSNNAERARSWCECNWILWVVRVQPFLSVLSCEGLSCASACRRVLARPGLSCASACAC